MGNDSVHLSTFPCSSYQALAFLYTQNQDLKGKTPTEITNIYLDAYEEAKTANENYYKSKR